jgi:hypothetical protein
VVRPTVVASQERAGRAVEGVNYLGRDLVLAFVVALAAVAAAELLYRIWEQF